MSTSEDLQYRLRRAWASFHQNASKQEVDAIMGAINQAHDAAQQLIRGDTQARPRHPELAHARSMLDLTVAAPLARTEQNSLDPVAATSVSGAAIIDGEGALWGTAKYEQLDVSWVATLIDYLEHPKPTTVVPFGASPQTIEIASEVNLALIGDWGTGYWRGDATPACKVAAQVNAKKPDYTIHLGDTYYAGTSAEVSDNLNSILPRGSKGRFAVPGNHELYKAGGEAFYSQLEKQYPLQKGSSFFALVNANWLIIALDTAYNATSLYQDGHLSDGSASQPPQINWMYDVLEKYPKQSVIVLSHHQPFSLTGDQRTALHGEVDSIMKGNQRDIRYWYWGHLHNAVVYNDKVMADYLGRCIGHGGIPYGVASDITGSPNVTWAETKQAGDPDQNYAKRLLNGFLLLELNGSRLTESFIAEDGSTRWSHAYPK